MHGNHPCQRRTHGQECRRKGDLGSLSKVAPEAVAETMAKLIREGKIRAWGISEADEEYLRRAHAVCPVTAIQNRYSMMARWHEKLFPVVEELGIAYVAFSPMTNGFLTGQYTVDSKIEPHTDFRSKMPQYIKEGFEKAHELLELLKTMATAKKCHPGADFFVLDAVQEALHYPYSRQPKGGPFA